MPIRGAQARQGGIALVKQATTAWRAVADFEGFVRTTLDDGEAMLAIRRIQKVAASLGGGWPRAIGRDGEGWGYDRSRVSCVRGQCSRALAVATAGRLSPSETHMFGSAWDCRFTNR